MKPLTYLAVLLMTLSAAQASPVDAGELTQIWDRINQEIKGSSQLIQWDRERYLTSLTLTYHRLKEQQRILDLDADERKEMGLPDQICHDNKQKKKDCHPFLGFYIPLTDTIVLDKGLSHEKKTWVLLHELIHATQYFLRLPLDVSGLLDSNLPKDKLIEHLSFFQEAQANWYTLTVGQNKLWMDERKSDGKLKASIIFKSYLVLLTLGTINSPLKYAFQKLLPEVDKIHGWRAPYYHQRAEHILSLHELVVLNTWRGGINPAINIDLKFHQKFTRALETAYYGDLDFLLSPGAEDQKIFKKMHDRYYDFLSLPEGHWEQCLKQITNETIAHGTPLNAWLNNGPDKYGACGFENLSFFKNKDLFRELLGSQAFFRKGTEGSGPPTLNILPQIEILPKRKGLP